MRGRKPEMVFKCSKCEHLLFVRADDRSLYDLAKILERTSCPTCGQSPEENWTYVRMGNYNKEVLKGEVNESSN